MLDDIKINEKKSIISINYPKDFKNIPPANINFSKNLINNAFKKYLEDNGFIKK